VLDYMICYDMVHSLYDDNIDKKFELMLTRRTKAYSSYGSVV